MQLIQSHPFRSGGVLLVVVVAIALLVWWLVPKETPPVSAQQVLADACADAADLEYVDFTTRLIYEVPANPARSHEPIPEDPPYYYEYEVTEHTQRMVSYEGNNVIEEQITIFPEIDDTVHRSTETQVDYTTYYRVKGDGGGWEEWIMDERSHPLPPSSPSGLFCGFSRDIFDTLEDHGEETVHGVQTRKFVATVESDGDPTQAGPFDARLEMWVDSNGRYIQAKDVSPYTGAAMLYVFSGWGEENIITAPVGTQPKPTLAPTLEPTVEPTLEPTVEATVPSVPVDAWLEPDPTTVTFNGEWRTFTIRGTGTDRVRFYINVRNPNGQTSTGAVELDSRSTPRSAIDSCETTYYPVTRRMSVPLSTWWAVNRERSFSGW